MLLSVQPLAYPPFLAPGASRGPFFILTLLTLLSIRMRPKSLSFRRAKRRGISCAGVNAVDGPLSSLVLTEEGLFTVDRTGGNLLGTLLLEWQLPASRMLKFGCHVQPSALKPYP